MMLQPLWTMTAICFVCNLPILSHQVGLEWQGGNGWDDLMREQVEESTLRQRLGTGRRDSATQITPTSPPNEPQESSPTNQRRRRSSLAQLTDILREWGGGGTSGKSSRGNKLCRRETLADIAKSLPWSRQTTTDASHLERLRKRRESSVDSGIRSQASTKSRRDSAISDFKNDIAKLWGKKDATPQAQPPPTVISPTPRRESSAQAETKRLDFRTMTAICFVCNLPILSHQVGLEWQGGNGWDDLMREQVEESTLRQRLGTGRRDSATQITPTSPPNEPQESSPTNQRRRRSSLAQLTDILREWGGGGTSGKSSRGNKLCRRETLADIAKSLPWSRQTTTDASHLERLRKRRESSVDSGIRSQASTKSRRDSAISDFKNDIAKLWGKKDATPQAQPPPTVISPTPRRDSGESRNSRRGSSESARSRRDSVIAGQTPSPGERKHNCRHHRRRQSQQSVDSGSGVTPTKYYRNDQRPSASSTDSTASNAVRDHLETRNSMDKSDRSSSIEAKTVDTKTVTPTTTTTTTTTPQIDGKIMITTTTDSKTSTITTTTTVTTSTTLTVDTKTTSETKNLTLETSITPPTIVMSSVTPPSVSPTAASNLPLPGTSTSGSSSPVGSPNVNTPTHPLLTTRRDSTTQCYYKGKEASPNKFSRLTRQAAAIDESMPPTGRRGSQPTLSPDPDEGGRKARRDSLSPDSASYPKRRDSRSHLSPDRTVDKRDISPIRQRKSQLRRQSTSMAGRSPPRSPDSSSCSSRDPSPSPCAHAPAIRRQSTTDEIFIARGFRRQSTAEEMIRCRNFRRQSSQSDETVQRYRGRRDSSAQITDGTFATMTVETSSTFFDSSTQTENS
nr:PREDICTED: nuclear pore complex protein DDB_G0274915-like [Megachile rotundata]